MIQLSLENILSAIFISLFAIVGYFMSRVIQRQDELSKNLEEHRVANAKELVRKDDYNYDRNKTDERFKEVSEKLDIIIEKLGNKADRH
jgi:hypothetical protein